MRRHSAGEPAVVRDRRMTQRVAYYAGGLAGEAALRAAWASFAELAVKLHTDEDTITDPRARALLKKVDKELLEYHKQHVVGFLKMAAEQAAPQISRDITRASLGPVLLISACGAGVEQSAPEAGIVETFLDFLGNPFKLRGPEISPPPVTLLRVPENLPATMPKEGEQPAQDPGENKTQPKHIGIPSHGAETLFRRDNEQAVSDRVVELGRQLAEARQETKQAQAQLVETQRDKAELERQLTERDHQLVEARQEAKQAQDALLSLRKQKAVAQRDRRQNLGEQGRAHHAEYMREWRARRRQQGSP